MSISTKNPWYAVMQNEHFWPKHWQRQIRKIDHLIPAGDFVYAYFVLPRNADGFMTFSTPEEIDRWARVADRMERS